jgi:RNA polymerase sigma factor (sigma-70 family)
VERPEAWSDGLLLRRFVDRQDRAAFEEIVRRHRGMVASVCRRVLKDPHAAEDAFQATFLALAQKARSIRRTESIGGWLRSVAFNTALAAKASESRREASVSRFSHPAHTPNPDDRVQRESIRRVLEEELGRLPEKYRLPIVLCYFQGETNERAALRLGHPKGTMSTLLTQGRELLRRRLERRGLIISGGALLAFLATGSGAGAPSVIAAAAVVKLAAVAAVAAAILGGTAWIARPADPVPTDPVIVRVEQPVEPASIAVLPSDPPPETSPLTVPEPQPPKSSTSEPPLLQPGTVAVEAPPLRSEHEPRPPDRRSVEASAAQAPQPLPVPALDLPELPASAAPQVSHAVAEALSRAATGLRIGDSSMIGPGPARPIPHEALFADPDSILGEAVPTLVERVLETARSNIDRAAQTVEEAMKVIPR